jgi:hypothetical protein
LKGESVVVSGLQRGEESEKEDGASEKVEDAIEDHLAIHRDSISAL